MPPTSMQRAIYEYSNNNRMSYRSVAESNGISISHFRRIFSKWRATVSQNPSSAADIVVPVLKLGRPTDFTGTEEALLRDVALDFAQNNTPLSIKGIQDAASHLIEMSADRHQILSFKNSTPLCGWACAFVQRHADLKIKTVQVIEQKRLAAVTPSVVAEQIARLNAAMQKYNVKDARCILNVDESGCNFVRQSGRSLRRGIGPVNMKLTQTLIRTKCKLTNITVIPTVAADVLPGNQAHYRRVAAGCESPVDHFPPCYLYYRDPAAVDSDIFFDLAHHFVAETAHLLEENQYNILFVDGYSAHVQYLTLEYLKANRVVVAAMPAHSSHRLQPLDVGVFVPFNSALQEEVHSVARVKKVIDMFTAVKFVSNAYKRALTFSNIRSGFYKTGVWDFIERGACMKPLSYLFDGYLSETVTLECFLHSFHYQTRRLLDDEDVIEQGTLRVDTKKGAHLTSNAVVMALDKRDKRCAQRRAKKK